MHLSNRNQNLPLLKPKSKLKRVPNRKQPSRATLSYLGRRRSRPGGRRSGVEQGAPCGWAPRWRRDSLGAGGRGRARARFRGGDRGVGQPAAVADRAGGVEVDGGGGRGGEGGGRGVGREGAAEGVRWRVCGRRRVGRELDGGGRGEHDGVGREEGAWGGSSTAARGEGGRRRRREGIEWRNGHSRPAA